MVLALWIHGAAHAATCGELIPSSQGALERLTFSSRVVEVEGRRIEWSDLVVPWEASDAELAALLLASCVGGCSDFRATFEAGRIVLRDASPQLPIFEECRQCRGLPGDGESPGGGVGGGAPDRNVTEIAARRRAAPTETRLLDTPIRLRAGDLPIADFLAQVREALAPAAEAQGARLSRVSFESKPSQLRVRLPDLGTAPAREWLRAAVAYDDRPGFRFGWTQVVNSTLPAQWITLIAVPTGPPGPFRPEVPPPPLSASAWELAAAPELPPPPGAVDDRPGEFAAFAAAQARALQAAEQWAEAWCAARSTPAPR